MAIGSLAISAKLFVKCRGATRENLGRSGDLEYEKYCFGAIQIIRDTFLALFWGSPLKKFENPDLRLGTYIVHFTSEILYLKKTLSSSNKMLDFTVEIVKYLFLSLHLDPMLLLHLGLTIVGVLSTILGFSDTRRNRSFLSQ